jgi:hypothetical protein
VAPGLEGAEHADHERVLGEGEDVALHEHLLDLVPQDQVLLVDLLDGETLPGVPVPHQVHGPVRREGGGPGVCVGTQPGPPHLAQVLFGFALAKQVLYGLSHTSSPFCAGYFGDGVSKSSPSQPPKWLGLQV